MLDLLESSTLKPHTPGASCEATRTRGEERERTRAEKDARGEKNRGEEW